MKYVMLGDDNSGTEEKLAKYTGNVPRSYLASHYENDTLFFVDPELKLETVGAVFTEDRSKQVEEWLKSGDLVKIEDLHVKQWAESECQFEALVVSPFVLCRPA
ncbi:MAG: DUF2288 family protein [Roseibacillus sp.]|jgi:hypothetical protein